MNQVENYQILSARRLARYWREFGGINVSAAEVLAAETRTYPRGAKLIYGCGTNCAYCGSPRAAGVERCKSCGATAVEGRA